MNRLLSICAAALLVVACRDLQFPSGNDAVNLPPVVSFVTPATDQLVPVAPVIQVDARDPNGIADVTLSCGGVPVYVWRTPPYMASVDLSHCPAGDAGSPGLRTVELDAIARDSLLLASEPVRLQVRIDTSMAQLTVQMPERGVPGGSLSLRITSDRTLGAIPTANIGSLAAQVTERADLEAGAPLTIFDAVFSPLPGLGTDLYDGGSQDIPIEVLQQVEQARLLEIEGRAPNGNSTRMVLQLLLSRVAWQRTPPGYYSPPTASDAQPVATDGGLVLPMMFGRSGWLPAYFSHETGTFTAFGRTDLVRDAGYQLGAIDAEGRVWLAKQVGATAPQTQYVYVNGPTSATAPQLTDRLLYAGSGYARVGQGLCAEEGRTDGGFCAGITRTLVCATPSGDVRSAVATNALDSESTVPGVTTTSAGVYWAAAYQPGTCSMNNVAFAATPGGAANVVLLPQSENPPVQMVSFENGSVALTYPSITGPWTTITMDSTGKAGASFFSPAALIEMGIDPAMGLPPWLILAGRPDGTLVTLHYEDPYTVLEIWREGAAVPVRRFRIPGYYEGTDPRSYFGYPISPPESVLGADGSLAILLTAPTPGMNKISPAPGGVAGVALGSEHIALFVDQQFRPRWLYRPGSNTGHLIANRTGSRLYYVDVDSQQVTALAR